MDNLTPQQIQQMIAMLQSMLPTSEPTNDEQPVEMAHVDNPIKTKTPRKVGGKFENKFDQMMEARLHQEDKEIDKALAIHAPTPRSRRFEPISVVCRVCGKNETVNPAVLSESKDRYKCNACARSPG